MAQVEVILTKKIEGLGAEADVVAVRPGYARNYLIPQKFAAPATAASKKQIEDLRRKRAEREAEELNEAQELATKLSKLILTFTLKAGAGQDKVFGAVTSQDIANEVAAKGFEIDRRKIDLPKPIKGSGDHEVKVDLGHGVSSKLKLVVTVETAQPAAEPEAAPAEAPAEDAPDEK
ncbi:MAG: 50S ribosomal protein L9 [Verrucomicrobiota bacterium]